MQNNISKYPNTFYRVSLKAIIRNEKGHVLLVKENGSKWSLPGGGMDHEEPFEKALAREIYEEALITQPFSAKVLGVDSFFAPTKEAYLLWVVCELTFQEPVLYGVGEDASEADFVDPAQFEGSPNLSEQLVYKWCVKNCL